MQIGESHLRLVVRGILRESTDGSSLLHPGVTVQDLARDWVSRQVPRTSASGGTDPRPRLAEPDGQ